MSGPAILILAAGASARMRGADKLLQDLGGQPLLAVMVARAQATGLPCYVTLPDPGHPRAPAAAGAQPVFVPDADQGMAASIRAGVAALPETVSAALILPADMPEIETADLQAVVAAFDPDQPRILRAATAQGVPGHPVLFPRRHFAELLELSGDQGARAVLKHHPVDLVTLPGQHALTDLDTPEDWARWRAARAGPEK